MQKFENHNSTAIKLDVYKLYTMRNQVQVEIFTILLVIFNMLLAILAVSKITIFFITIKNRGRPLFYFANWIHSFLKYHVNTLVTEKQDKNTQFKI